MVKSKGGDEYMSVKLLSKEELKVHEERLLLEREKSLDYIRRLNDNQQNNPSKNSGAASAHAIHQADHGSDTYNRERQASMLEKEHKQLKRLNAALKRVYDGTYGVCETCGKRINTKRLEIVPYAFDCIDCRSANDIKDRKKSKKRNL